MQIQSLICLGVASVSASCGQMLLKVGAAGRQSFTEFLNLPILAGLILYAVGTALWIFVLSKESLVSVYGFTALTFVLVYGGSVLALGERLTMHAAVGVSLVLAGLFLITR